MVSSCGILEMGRMGRWMVDRTGGDEGMREDGGGRMEWDGMSECVGKSWQ